MFDHQRPFQPVLPLCGLRKVLLLHCCVLVEGVLLHSPQVLQCSASCHLQFIRRRSGEPAQTLKSIAEAEFSLLNIFQSATNTPGKEALDRHRGFVILQSSGDLTTRVHGMLLKHLEVVNIIVKYVWHIDNIEAKLDCPMSKCEGASMLHV